jgi:tripartite-type tricarboxylate transporter receptor subunit TctC
VAELVEYARANPGKLTLATSSIASINHFLGELLKLRTGIGWTEVHYRGNAPAITDLVAGHVDIGLQQLVDSFEHIRTGRLRALAVLGPKRAAVLPDVPTSAEAGYPDVQGVTFNGIFAPKETPPAIVEKLSLVVREALTKPDVIERLAALGSEARGAAPDEFRQFLQRETEKWTEVMKQAKIKVTQ